MRLTTVDMGYICLLMFVSVYKRPSSLQYCGAGYGASGLDFADALRFLGMVSCGVVDMVTYH